MISSFSHLSSSPSLKTLCLRSSRPLAYLTPKDIQPTEEIYKAKLKELRKQWAADYKLEQQRLSEEKAAHVKRMILQKAITLREKRNTAAKRAEAQRIRREKIKQNYLEHVAKMTVLEQQKNEIRKQRFERLVKMHEAESKYWITLENLEKKITEELFATPATTGVVTEISEYWRYCCPSMQPNRTLGRLLEADDDPDSDEDSEDEDENTRDNDLRTSPNTFMSPIDYYLNNEEQITTQKESIRGMLNAMIGEGSDREKFETMVNQFVELAENLNGPMGEVNPMKKFASDEIPRPRKNGVTAEDLMELVDPTDPVIAKKAIREVQEYALEKEGDELKNLVKPFVPSHMKNSSLKELLLPKESEDDDSDYDSLLQDDNDQDMINSSSSSSSNVVNTSTPPRSRELYETAESITVDDLLDDVNYIDENNMKDLKELYERIKNRMRKDH